MVEFLLFCLLVAVCRPLQIALGLLVWVLVALVLLA